MYVIEVIPLQKGAHIDTLAYFGSTSYNRGTLLTVPIRSRTILAMVTGVTEVSMTKTALRAATFSLKKLPSQEHTQALSPAYIRTAEVLADRYPASVGSILHALLPPEIKNGDVSLPHTHHIQHEERHQPEILQGTQNDRILTYRSLIRETFAHSGSVLIVAPTGAEAAELHIALKTGIEERTFMCAGTMTKRQIKESYRALEDFSKPKLIIATPTYALLERHDIMVTIIESSRSPHYKERTRPYLDYREVLTLHAAHTGRRIIFADLFHRCEEESLRRDEIYQTLEGSFTRIMLPGALRVVHMKDTSTGDVPFRLFAPKVLTAIKRTLEKKGRVFLFAARRGMAPVVGCIDCAYIFRSPQTGAPLSLIRLKKDGVEHRWFVCGSSGYREKAADTCPECGSWRLRERGIGIQHVYEELAKELPKTPIVTFDHTTARTYKKSCFLRDTFYGTKGGIMLGTQMAVPYLTKTIDTSIVVNMDALYATPTWRLQEDNFALLLRLREQTSGTLYVQFRGETDSLLSNATRGAGGAFYDDELELRKMCNYPPYTIFVHLTWQGSPSEVANMEKHITTQFEQYDVATYNAPPTPMSKKQNAQIIKYGLIRIATSDWPPQKLLNELRVLPPSVRIVINPERII